MKTIEDRQQKSHRLAAAGFGNSDEFTSAKTRGSRLIESLSVDDVLVRGPIAVLLVTGIVQKETGNSVFRAIGFWFGGEPKDWFWLVWVVALQNPKRAFNRDWLTAVYG